ncbi:type VII secretion-associated serine protease [Actinocatenispora thailandica]|uniref:Type VII secretion-associated serine protease n=1 Tax=Actinocatenispora thailandica TaxID=227318 RepID=A0A7R7DUL1_9ACTN|nr:S8 family serine peptidase [Actinocatenispora thailandica]BCJ37985.1 type VII secretion-associated serine protease [Actinocatenispora thailandica]
MTDVFARTPRNETRHRTAALAAIVAGGLTALAISAPVAASSDGQWYLDALHVRQAQKISTGRGVTVAVIDSGIDKTRPALSGRLVPGKCFGSAKGADPTLDFNGHGTGMAGLVGGNGKDSRQILGMAPGAQLMPLCVSGDDTTQDALLSSITPAIRYAVDHGATVISMSLGAYENHALDSTVAKLHNGIAYAEAHNVVLVAGVGNKGQGNEGVLSPARLSGVVAVSGIGTNGKLWNDSVTGEQVALAAPAEHILSTDTTNKFKDGKPVDSTGYQIASGTSAATALVAGAAALVRAKYPKLDAANVINRLIKTADHKGVPGRNPQYGYGIVDPVKALTAHVDPVDSNPLGQLDARGTGGSSSKAVAAPGKTGNGGGSNVGVWIAVGATVLVIIVVLIVVLAARSRRRRAPVTADGWQPSTQPSRDPGSLGPGRPRR